MFSSTATLAEKYGVQETNGLMSEGYHESVDYTGHMTLAEVAANGGKITRVRLLTERWPSGRKADISYIHATLPDGTTVPVTDYPAANDLRNVKGDFIEWAKESGVYAKGLGLLDENNWSILY